MATSSLQAAAISSQARRSRSLDALSALSQHASRFARKLSDMLPLQNHSTYSLAVPNRYKSAPLSTSLCNETLKMEGAYGHLGCHAKSAFAFIAKQSNICCKRVAENKGFLDTHIRFLARQSYGPALVSNDLKRPAAPPKIAMHESCRPLPPSSDGTVLSRRSYLCGVTIFLVFVRVSAPRMLHRA
jgi:hypothetical protein